MVAKAKILDGAKWHPAKAEPVSAFRAQFSADTWAMMAHILKPLEEVGLPAPTGWNVMVAQWIRPTKTTGGILLSGLSTNEDKYQGRCGVVLALGPDAYAGERYPNGAWCKVGDIVAWPAMENAASRMEYAKQVITVIPDDRVVMVGVDPAQVS